MSEDSRSAEYAFSRRQIVWGMTAIFAVYGLMAYFLQTLNIARPKLAAELNGMSLYAWSVSIPSLASAFVTLIFGKLSDMYGRRIMLMISLIAALIGTILSALSQNFVFFIAASVISAVGTGAMMPLVFAVVGDMFPPERRARWIGLLNIPIGFFSLIGPTLGGWFVDNLSWRHLYWMSLPLLVVCLIAVPVGVPSVISAGAKRKIDVLGCVLVGIASSTLILGFSFAGDQYPWGSPQILGLLGTSLIFWVLFLRTEGKVDEPILDPLVLRNRPFLTIASANFLSFFGQMGMMMYFPMFLQGVQGMGAMQSGQIITPYSVLMAFIGVPVGFLLGRKAHFKWMYVVGYALLTLDMFAVVFFKYSTPGWVSVLVAVIAGIGLGAIPTVNTMVIQNAVPKRLLGVAMGATFFVLLMGVAISPALLGSVMNASYARALDASLPDALRQLEDDGTVQSLGDSKVLLSQPALEELRKRFLDRGPGGEELFDQTVQSIRNSMETALRSVFWVGAITMLFAFVIISTIPRSWAAEEKAEPFEPAVVTQPNVAVD